MCTGTPFRWLMCTGTPFRSLAMCTGTPFRSLAMCTGTPFRLLAEMCTGTPFRELTGTEFRHTLRSKPGTEFRHTYWPLFSRPGTEFRYTLRPGTEFRYTFRHTYIHCAINLTLLLLPTAAVQAQSFEALDARIAYFEEHALRDSFMACQQQKSALAKQYNQLDTWAWAQVDMRDFIEQNDVAALAIAETALQQAWRKPVTPAEAEPFLYLHAACGWHLGNLGRIWQAAQAFEQARALYQQHHYPDCEAIEGIYKPLGNHYTRLGDNDRALAVFREALQQTADTESLAGLQYNIGLALWNQRQSADAEKTFAQALTLRGISTRRRGLLLRGMALTALQRNAFAEALRYAGQSLRYLDPYPTDRSSRLERASALRTAASACRQLGQYTEALRQLREATTLLQNMPGRELAKTLTDLADLLIQQGDCEQALAHSHTALQMLIPSFRPAQAADLPAAEALFEEIALSEVFFVKAKALAGIFTQKKDLYYLTAAHHCHQLAFQSEQKLRHILYYRASKLDLQAHSREREIGAMQVVWLLWEHTRDPRWPQEAVRIAERSKAALLLDYVQEHLIRQQLSGRDPRFEQLHLLEAQRAEVQHQRMVEPKNPAAAQQTAMTDALTLDIAQLRQALLKDYPQLSGTLDHTQPTAFCTKDMGADETVLEYFWGAPWLEVLVLRREGVVLWHRISIDSVLETNIGAFVRFFSAPNAITDQPAAYLHTAHTLYRQLIPDAVQATRRLCIIPDDRLYTIPFEALATDKGGSVQSAPYLLRRCEVRYAWSLAVLQRQQQLRNTTPPRSMMAVAPTFGSDNRRLAPLTAARNEWANMTSFTVQTLFDGTATAGAFAGQANHHRLIHLATHAATAPLPRIEFADRSMLLPELYALRLEADVVVLSACETGLGTYERGEGVQSLANAFAQSGAAGIIAGLWSVSDKSTARLFGHFYRHLNAGMPTAAALHTAKLDYLTDPTTPILYQSPYYWAGMVLTGDSRQFGASDTVWWWYWAAGFGLLMAGLSALRYYRRK